MSISTLVSSGNRVFVTVANRLQSPFLLLIRLYSGWQFAQTGWGKFHPLPQVTEFFTSLGLPMPHANALFISSLELVGGVLFALGLGSRWISLLLAGDMFVAYVVANREALRAVFIDPRKFYNAEPHTFLFASLMILVFGSGLFAIDTLLDRIWGSRTRHGRSRALPSPPWLDRFQFKVEPQFNRLSRPLQMTLGRI
jgi:putative oxidoreductase